MAMGITYLFEFVLVVEVVDVAQKMAAICSGQLIDADQQVHQADVALSEHGKQAGLELP